VISLLRITIRKKTPALTEGMRRSASSRDRHSVINLIRITTYKKENIPSQRARRRSPSSRDRHSVINLLRITIRKKTSPHREQEGGLLRLETGIQ
jgi:hypothetical protein